MTQPWVPGTFTWSVTLDCDTSEKESEQFRRSIENMLANVRLSRRDRLWFWWHLRMDRFYAWLLRRLSK